MVTVFRFESRVILCNSEWPETHYITQIIFELMAILLPQPPKYKIIGMHCCSRLKRVTMTAK